MLLKKTFFISHFIRKLYTTYKSKEKGLNILLAGGLGRMQKCTEELQVHKLDPSFGLADKLRVLSKHIEDGRQGLEINLSMYDFSPFIKSNLEGVEKSRRFLYIYSCSQIGQRLCINYALSKQSSLCGAVLDVAAH